MSVGVLSVTTLWVTAGVKIGRCDWRVFEYRVAQKSASSPFFLFFFVSAECIEVWKKTHTICVPLGYRAADANQTDRQRPQEVPSTSFFSFPSFHALFAEKNAFLVVNGNLETFKE